MLNEQKKSVLAVSIVLFFILITAFAVRFYKHHDWLYFKMDQSRDAALISNSILNGPEYLPLLGPRAGATDVPSGYLRLGPAFYYFQYIAGKLFNSTSPDVLAYPELFFSMAAIIILYFFLSLYFSKTNSLLITAMYAFSFIVIQYSRFAWNPNTLFFWTILSFWSLLKFLNEESLKKKYTWIAVCSVALAVGSQLHFLGFFTLVGIFGLVMLYHYEVWKKENILGFFQKENLKKFLLYAVIFLAFFTFIYAPVIISDVMKNGENTKNFFYAIGSKPQDKPLLEKIFKNIEEQTKYFSLLFTSVYYTDAVKKHLLPVSATLLAFLVGAILACRSFWKKEEKLKKDFIVLIFAWLSVFFILSIPVAFQIRPRFFILVFALPFIFLGFFYEFLEEKFSQKKYFAAVILLTAAVIASNGYGTYLWFAEQSLAQGAGTKDVKRTLILKVRDGVTLGQLQRVADYIYAEHKSNATVYYYVKPEHVSPLKYLFTQKRDSNFKFLPLKINSDPNAQYFAIVPFNNGTKNIQNKIGDTFDVLSREVFGQLAVYEIEIKNRKISADFRFNKEVGKSDRLFWKDALGIEGNPSVQVEGGE
jgi:hypothetical protein